MWGNQDAAGSPLINPEGLAVILVMSTEAVGIGILGWRARKGIFVN
jgi:hypothetical protein